MFPPLDGKVSDYLAWKPSVIAVLTVIVAYWLFQTVRPTKVNRNKMDIKSVEVQNEPGVYCCPDLGSSGKLQPFMYPELQTLYDALLRGRDVASKHGDTRMLGRFVDGKYEWLSYDEVFERVELISSGLISSGVKPGQDTRIAIFSINCAEWMITFLSCMFQNIVVVPINRYLNDEGIVHIVNQCDIEILFVKTCEDATRINPLLVQCPKLKTVVVFDGVSPDFKAQDFVNYVSLSDMEELGRKKIVSKNLPCHEDVVSICYTSGATGMPKGAIITHSMILATVSSFLRIHKAVAVEGDEILISYLPLAHIFGFVAECICLTEGYKIGYFSGNIKEFTRDMQALRPTFFPAVPRIMNAIYDRVQAQLQTVSPLKRFIFGLAVKRKAAFMQRTGSFRHPVYDRYLFSKVQRILGNRVRFVIVGGSASQQNVMAFMKTVLGCPVVEGYGQTETCSGTICQRCGDLTVGNVGVPLPCLHVKLAPIEQQKSKNVGEVCIRGANVTPRYFRYTEPEAFDSDGWLHTGDIARRNSDGSFSLIDRKKEIFKLSQGEYVAPVKVENCYAMLDVIAQIFVTGWPEKAFCVAIVVPEERVLRQKVSKLRASDSDSTVSELCGQREVVDMILGEMNEQAKTMKLSGVERVHRIHLEPEPFSIENGLLTTTFKIRRPVAAKHYRSQIQKLYDAN